MADSFVSRKDRIIASAIEIISDSGLSALTTKNLSMKENMSEALLYKYFGGINEVLVAVVEYYAHFDAQIRKSIETKDEPYMAKLGHYLDAYATYYDNYYAIATLMLQYEELLHNVDTRDIISACIIERRHFQEELIRGAIEAGEISDKFTPEELATSLAGIGASCILSRRIAYHKKTFKQEYLELIAKWYSLIKL